MLSQSEASLAFIGRLMDLGEAVTRAALSYARGDIPRGIAYTAAAGIAVKEMAVARSHGARGSGGSGASPPAIRAAAPARDDRGGSGGPGDVDLTVELYGTPLGRGVGRAMGDDARRGGWRLSGDVIGDSAQTWVSP